MAGVEPDVVVVFESDDGVAAEEAAGAGAVSLGVQCQSPDCRATNMGNGRKNVPDAPDAAPFLSQGFGGDAMAIVCGLSNFCAVGGRW